MSNKIDTANEEMTDKQALVRRFYIRINLIAFKSHFIHNSTSTVAISKLVSNFLQLGHSFPFLQTLELRDSSFFRLRILQALPQQGTRIIFRLERLG
jgi:hypothetical protein